MKIHMVKELSQALYSVFLDSLTEQITFLDLIVVKFGNQITSNSLTVEALLIRSFKVKENLNGIQVNTLEVFKTVPFKGLESLSFFLMIKDVFIKVISKTTSLMDKENLFLRMDRFMKGNFSSGFIRGLELTKVKKGQKSLKDKL